MFAIQISYLFMMIFFNGVTVSLVFYNFVVESGRAASLLHENCSILSYMAFSVDPITEMESNTIL